MSAYTLTQTTPSRVTVRLATAFSVKLTVTSADAVGFPPKVFVMQQAPDAEDPPWFNCVASPPQIIDYPEDSPNPPIDGVQQPYFRVAELTVVTRSPSALEAFIARVQEELQILEENLLALSELDPP